MIAGLQVEVKSCSFCFFPGLPQGQDFGMGLARPVMITGPHNGLTLDDHGPDHGIGAGLPLSLPGQTQGQAHELFIGWAVFHGISGYAIRGK
jgi:hypothetical protein